VWSYTTDDKVVSSPSIANGVVYVGSYDHFVYAIGSVAGQPSEPASLWIVWVAAAVVVVLAVAAIILLVKRRR